MLSAHATECTFCLLCEIGNNKKVEAVVLRYAANIRQ